MYTAPPEHVTYVYTRPLHHALPIPVGAWAGPVAGDGVDDAVDAGERLPGLGLVAEVAERHPSPLRQPTAVGGAGLEAPLPLLVEDGGGVGGGEDARLAVVVHGGGGDPVPAGLRRSEDVDDAQAGEGLEELGLDGGGEHGASRHEGPQGRSEEHTSELLSLMRTSYAVFCLKKKINYININ